MRRLHAEEVSLYQLPDLFPVRMLETIAEGPNVWAVLWIHLKVYMD